MIDKDGEWEVHSGFRLLIKPSAEFEERRRRQEIKSAKQGAKRAVVQAERDRCIAYLKKQRDLSRVNLASKGYTEPELEMSFEDIIESVRANREAALRPVQVEE